MPTKAPRETKVTKSIQHDRIYVAAKFPTGGTFRFSVSRSGETLTFGGSNDPKIAKQQGRTLKKMTECLKGENNAARIERIAARLRTAGSIRQLCNACESDPLLKGKSKVAAAMAKKTGVPLIKLDLDRTEYKSERGIVRWWEKDGAWHIALPCADPDPATGLKTGGFRWTEAQYFTRQAGIDALSADETPARFTTAGAGEEAAERFA